MTHIPVLFEEVLAVIPDNCEQVLDLTAGGGGHSIKILEQVSKASIDCWDQDPLAYERLKAVAGDDWQRRVFFEHKNFKTPPDSDKVYQFILADLGLSSFQLDDKERGISIFSDVAPDFRMDPSQGCDFYTWLSQVEENDLADYIFHFADERKSRRVAKCLKSANRDEIASCSLLAKLIVRALAYKTHSRKHPATRIFQALRMAINDEYGALQEMLSWAPKRLSVGGRLAIISFHSVEDRLVKHTFRSLAKKGPYKLLQRKPIIPTEIELQHNIRARSAKLRVIERYDDSCEKVKTKSS